jgi:hypothetical protein
LGKVFTKDTPDKALFSKIYEELLKMSTTTTKKKQSKYLNS